MFVLAIDQGTSSTKSVIFDDQGNAIAKGHADLHTNYFDDGFVEQDPEGIFQNVLESVSHCFQNFENKGFNLDSIASCGISNQRETFILWDKSGKALAPAVVWACKRSVAICQKLISDEYENAPIGGWGTLIREKTGLILDPYFSATKLLWLFENDATLKAKLNNGEVYFGTVDCWLLWKLTSGKSFKTDHTNASRTLLFNIHTLKWDTEILKLWGLEKLHLPEVCPSSFEFGSFDLTLVQQILKTSATPAKSNMQLLSLPIQAMVGDSHAALFGEGCFASGTAKATLGTGCSIMMNIGEKAVSSSNGMLTTIAFSTQNQVFYAFEGAIVSCGSSIEWLKNELGLFKNVSETEKMAQLVSDNGGVYLIPAFSGLGAPHWQMGRKASIEGMTFGTTKNHIVRAALESVAYQIKDVIGAMSSEMQSPLKSISVNGGLRKNTFVMQFLADLLSLPLQKQENADVSALGAAFLAGLYAGLYKNLGEISKLIHLEATNPKTNAHILDSYHSWRAIIAKI